MASRTRSVFQPGVAASLLTLLLTAPSGAAADSASSAETPVAALCRIIDTGARAHGLSPPFLARLIWQESAFRPLVTSPAGAQGVAQFMPGTAHDRGLADPFDPEQAVLASAAFLAELATRFGNFGLAAAAYNAGPSRLADWLAGHGALPAETLGYVQRITGRTAEDWATDARGGLRRDLIPEPVHCPPSMYPIRVPQRVASRLHGPPLAAKPASPSTRPVPPAPWGVQLAGNFSKALALASFARARQAYAGVIGGARPIVIGTRLAARGTRVFYRVRLPAPTREAAEALCRRIQAANGACVTLHS
jgi:hypothetical protein